METANVKGYFPGKNAVGVHGISHSFGNKDNFSTTFIGKKITYLPRLYICLG